ncbi:MAG: hypothetical protein ACTTJC_02435 [Campylobacter sp.]
MKIGFVSGGNMGSAMIKMTVQKFGSQSIFECARSKNETLASEFEINVLMT